MRYTTILDLRDIPELYKSHNVRLVYLHLTLRAYYDKKKHGELVDCCWVALRQLAEEVGITPSECHTALNKLSARGYIKVKIWKPQGKHGKYLIRVLKNFKEK